MTKQSAMRRTGPLSGKYGQYIDALMKFEKESHARYVAANSVRTMTWAENAAFIDAEDAKLAALKAKFA
jgi:Arc/MetJ family transcription regulator